MYSRLNKNSHVTGILSEPQRSKRKTGQLCQVVKTNLKYQFYYITMLAVLIIAFIIFVFHVIQDFRYEDGKKCKGNVFAAFLLKKMPLSHSFASIFLIVCIISTLQSQYLYESFWGNEGRYTGLFLLAIYVITFLFISRLLLVFYIDIQVFIRSKI